MPTLYFDRWWILVTVLLLDVVNRGHCTAFAAVTKKAAKYYDQTGDKIDLIVVLSYAFSIPAYIFGAYVVETRGLKFSLRFGGLLTGIGRFFEHCRNIQKLS